MIPQKSDDISGIEKIFNGVATGILRYPAHLAHIRTGKAGAKQGDVVVPERA